MADKLNPEQRKLVLNLLEEKRERMRKVTPHPDNKLAVEAYNYSLVRLMKKLDPKGYRWL